MADVTFSFYFHFIISISDVHLLKFQSIFFSKIDQVKIISTIDIYCPLLDSNTEIRLKECALSYTTYFLLELGIAWKDFHWKYVGKPELSI